MTLQHFLSLSQTWAEKMNMQWSTAKCSIICKDARRADKEINLNGQELSKLDAAGYLGVTISAQGVAAENSTTLIQNAKLRLNDHRGMAAEKPHQILHNDHNSQRSRSPSEHIRTTFNFTIVGSVADVK